MRPMIELDKRDWNRFLRNLKAAAGDMDDIKDLWARILEPMRADWARRLPGSLRKTVKVRRKAQSGEIWAGYPNTRGDRPFLPWLEFGGRIRFRAGPRKFVEVVPFGQGKPFSTIRSGEGIWRDRYPEGRWRGPTIESQTDDIGKEFADGLQDIFERYFK
jgi:hypothetical protein